MGKYSLQGICNTKCQRAEKQSKIYIMYQKMDKQNISYNTKHQQMKKMNELLVVNKNIGPH